MALILDFLGRTRRELLLVLPIGPEQIYFPDAHPVVQDQVVDGNGHLAVDIDPLSNEPIALRIR
jgi:hypothetical protein